MIKQLSYLTIKFFVFFPTLFLSFLISSQTVLAEGEFAITFDVTYKVQETGKTQVTQDVTLTNKFSTIYATSYQLSLSGAKPQNIKVTENSTDLPFDVISQNEETIIKINFPDSLVGKDKSRNFQIAYTLTEIAFKNGAVWEVGLPKLADPSQFENYNVTLSVPQSFGIPAYISPSPATRQKTDSQFLLRFTGNQLIQGVVAAFGEFQVFDFFLAYHLQNPHGSPAQTEIALPPDTAYQRVYYQDITPQPEAIRLDEDGNWLAQFRLKARQRVDVKVAGTAQLFLTPQNFYPRTRPADLSRYLGESEFWQVSDAQLRQIAQSLKTPRQIYDFVVSYLTYDYERVQEGVARLGAVGAIENPKNAICLEFTDLFTTLARAAGIPAREVNGFAYTDNPKIQPLSLVADVLHAWPEYWDEAKNVWVPVDPTWGNTTGGVDYFSKLDLNHFTFAIHGQSPNEPYPAGSYKLGDNPQKDVNVSFGDLPAERAASFEVDFLGFANPIAFVRSEGKIKITNSGPVAAYDLQVQVQGKGLEITQPNRTIGFLPPFGASSFEVGWQAKLLGVAAPQVTVLVGSQLFSYNIPSSTWLVFQAGIILAALAVVTAAVVAVIFHAKISQKLAELTWRLPFQKRP